MRYTTVPSGARRDLTNPNWTLASEKPAPSLTDIQKNTMPVADAVKQAVAPANPILAGKS